LESSGGQKWKQSPNQAKRWKRGGKRGLERNERWNKQKMGEEKGKGKKKGGKGQRGKWGEGIESSKRVLVQVRVRIEVLNRALIKKKKKKRKKKRF
jgi:hypothetical protein